VEGALEERFQRNRTVFPFLRFCFPVMFLCFARDPKEALVIAASSSPTQLTSFSTMFPEPIVFAYNVTKNKVAEQKGQPVA
jgi:hypothetical protein